MNGCQQKGTIRSVLNECFGINNTWCTILFVFCKFITLLNGVVCELARERDGVASLQNRNVVNVVVRFWPQFGQITHNTIIILGAINSTTISVYLIKPHRFRHLFIEITMAKSIQLHYFNKCIKIPKIQSVSIFSVVILCVCSFVFLFFSLFNWSLHSK